VFGVNSMKSMMQDYKSILDAGEKVIALKYVVLLPMGEEKVEFSGDIAAKMEYIDKTYDDNLIMRANPSISIDEARFEFILA